MIRVLETPRPTRLTHTLMAAGLLDRRSLTLRDAQAYPSGVIAAINETSTGEHS